MALSGAFILSRNYTQEGLYADGKDVGLAYTDRMSISTKIFQTVVFVLKLFFAESYVKLQYFVTIFVITGSIVREVPCTCQVTWIIFNPAVKHLSQKLHSGPNLMETCNKRTFKVTAQ